MSYFSKMEPYAKKASGMTGINTTLILAQWYLETGGGTSSLSTRANNHAGIKASSKGKDYVSGAYAGYNNLDNFAKDYARVMGLSYYNGVRSAKGLEAQAMALHESPWAEDTNYYDKLMSTIKKNSLGDLGTSGTIAEASGIGGLFSSITGVLFSPLTAVVLAVIYLVRRRNS